MTPPRRGHPGLAGAALLGLAAGLVLFAIAPGIGVLLEPPPGHTMPHRDTAMALSGALAFVEDGWRWPLFAVEGLSARETNAVFTDSIPLHALAWKIVSGGDRAGFEHFLGVWLVLLMAFQGAAGAAALRVLGVTARGALIAGAAFCVVFPAFLFRVPMHAALAAHGFIILAVAMMLVPPRAGHAAPRAGGWAALLVAAALVHGYLLVMALACWAVAVAAELLAPAPSGGRGVAFARAGAVFGLLVAVMAAAGYFSGAPGGAGGFGLFRANLASPFQHAGGSLLPDWFPMNIDEESGYAYFPLGVWAVVAAALWLAVARRGAAKGAAGPRTLLAEPRGAVLVGLATLAVVTFAAAGRFAFGASELVAIPLPDWAEHAARTLRASGRFVWLPAYGVLLLAVATVALRLRPVPAGMLLGAAALASAIEMTPLRRAVIPAPGPYAADPVLARLVGEADRLAILPPWGCDPDHIPALDKELQFLAAKGRTLMVNGLAAARLARACRLPLPEGFLPEPGPGALIVVKHAGEGLGPLSRLGLDSAACRAHRGLALCRTDWPAEGPGAALPPVPAPQARLRVPLRLDFAETATAVRHLGAGFAAPEPWGVWSVGEEAAIELALAPDTAPPRRVALTLGGFVPPGRPATAVEAVLLSRAEPDAPWREEARARLAFDRATPRRTLVLARPDTRVAVLRVLLRPEAPVSPVVLGTGTDPRPLGVGVIALTLD